MWPTRLVQKFSEFLTKSLIHVNSIIDELSDWIIQFYTKFLFTIIKVWFVLISSISLASWNTAWWIEGLLHRGGEDMWSSKNVKSRKHSELRICILRLIVVLYLQHEDIWSCSKMSCKKKRKEPKNSGKRKQYKNSAWNSVNIFFQRESI